MTSRALLRPSAFPAGAAFLCLGGAVLLLGLSVSEVPSLAAASNFNRYDNDRDGLTDLQERVVGTRADAADTDGDGFSDLEEQARGASPLDPLSVPEFGEFGLGLCASQENGFLSVLSAIYLKDSDLSTVEFEMGVIYHGQVFRFRPEIQHFSRSFLRPGQNAQDSVAVVEIGLPETALARFETFSVFGVVRGTVPGAEDPIATSMTFKSIGGVIVAVTPTAARLSGPGDGGASGVVYRPLAADDQIPSTWNSGEICSQSTAAVGVSGVSMVFEVESADCIPMDTFCSPGACSEGVGRPLQLPDPAALAGG